MLQSDVHLPRNVTACVAFCATCGSISNACGVYDPSVQLSDTFPGVILLQLCLQRSRCISVTPAFSYSIKSASYQTSRIIRNYLEWDALSDVSIEVLAGTLAVINSNS